MMKKGAYNFEEAMEKAIKGEHVEIVDLISDKIKQVDGPNILSELVCQEVRNNI